MASYSELTRPELVQIVILFSDKLAEATDLEDEKRIMRQIFQHATSYQMLLGGSVPARKGGGKGAV